MRRSSFVHAPDSIWNEFITGFLAMSERIIWFPPLYSLLIWYALYAYIVQKNSRKSIPFSRFLRIVIYGSFSDISFSLHELVSSDFVPVCRLWSVLRLYRNPAQTVPLKSACAGFPPVLFLWFFPVQSLWICLYILPSYSIPEYGPVPVSTKFQFCSSSSGRQRIRIFLFNSRLGFGFISRTT